MSLGVGAGGLPGWGKRQDDPPRWSSAGRAFERCDASCEHKEGVAPLEERAHGSARVSTKGRSQLSSTPGPFHEVPFGKEQGIVRDRRELYTRSASEWRFVIRKGGLVGRRRSRAVAQGQQRDRKLRIQGLRGIIMRLQVKAAASSRDGASPHSLALAA